MQSPHHMKHKETTPLDIALPSPASLLDLDCTTSLFTTTAVSVSDILGIKNGLIILEVTTILPEWADFAYW